MNAQVPAQIKNQRSAPTNTPREVRVAYPYFHEKRTKNAAGVLFMSKKTGLPNPRYSGSLMFPKLAAEAGQCANYMFLWNLAIEAARKMWPTNLDAAGNWTWPVGAQYSVRDGDIPYVAKPKPGVIPATPEEIAKKNAWRNGYWIVEVENFFDPGPKIAKVIGGTEVELPAKVLNGIAQYKGGDFGVPNIHAYAYQNETFGVNFGFDGFCFTREGEAIGSSGPRSVEQMFGGIAGTVAPGGALPVGLPTVAAPPSAPSLPPSAPAIAPPAMAPSATVTAPMPTVSAPPSPPMPPVAPAPPLPAFPR